MAPARRRTDARRELGAVGEERAADWYEAAGFEVVARNWRCPLGEIDVVARRGRTVVICEVKTRRSDRFGLPAEAVTPAKQARLRRLAAAWLAEARAEGRLRGQAQIRFDVVSVLDGRLEVSEAAF